MTAKTKWLQKLQCSPTYLTNDFDAAKYFWDTEICGILSDDSNTLDGFGTDNQVVMYNISSVYRRNYDYTCPSDNCPSHVGDFQLSTDAVDDMTLHQSTTLGKNENIIEKSITLCELWIAPQAEISCNKSFETEPDHPYYISYDDHGKANLKCSGRRKPKNLAFNDHPPFLVFDISSTFRAEIKSLDTLSHQVTIYGQIYRLGGITSFVDNRSHYVAYIQYNISFFHYDGLPSINLKFKVQTDLSINGDVSLLCYFPCDPLSIESNSGGTSSNTKSSAEKSGDENIQMKSYKNLPNYDKDTETSDFLLAKALYHIEKDEAGL